MRNLIFCAFIYLQEHSVRSNAIPVPASGDPIQSIPTNGVPFGSGGGGGGNINNVGSQFSPNQNQPNGFNSRPNYFGSSSPLMPFPTSPNFLNQQPSQQFGAPLSYPYFTLYGGNSNTQQMLPYYGQFRPYQGGQGSGGIGAYGSASVLPLSSRFQSNLQFGQQSNTNLPTLFDRMDTAKQSDEQPKKPSQQRE